MDGSGDEGEVVLEVNWEGQGVDVWLGDLMQVLPSRIEKANLGVKYVLTESSG